MPLRISHEQHNEVSNVLMSLGNDDTSPYLKETCTKIRECSRTPHFNFITNDVIRFYG